MKKIVAISLTDLRMAFGSRAMWFTTLLMPIIFTAILAAGGGGGPTTGAIPLLVIDEDGGRAAQRLVAAIEGSGSLRLAQAEPGSSLPTTREGALAALDEVIRVLILPAGMTAALSEGRVVEPELHLASDHSVERSRSAQQALQALFVPLDSQYAAARLATREAEERRPFADEAERSAFFEAALDEAEQRQQQAAVTVRVEQASQLSVVPSGVVQSSPGQLVTFALVTLLGTSGLLVNERTMGTLRRLIVAPLSKGTILLGKVGGRFLIGLLQMALLIGVGQLLFGVQWGKSPLALALLVVAFALAALSMGLLLATVARSAEQAGQMTTALALLVAAVGGAWWPLEIVGEPLRTVALALPSGWAMSGFQAIILRGAGVSEVLPNVAALLGFTALFTALGLWRFRYE